jgi:hypothetical protein
MPLGIGDSSILIKAYLPVYQKEIWEGDIVEASIYEDEKPKILEVKNVDGCFVIDYESEDADIYPVGCFPGSIKIIGNIHENPDLLKEPK